MYLIIHFSLKEEKCSRTLGLSKSCAHGKKSFAKSNTWKQHCWQTLKSRKQLEVDMPIHRWVIKKTLLFIFPHISLHFCFDLIGFGFDIFLMKICFQKA